MALIRSRQSYRTGWYSDRTRLRWSRAALGALLPLLPLALAPTSLIAQQRADTTHAGPPARAGLSADSEIERYLRALQVAGIISPDVAWSARPFSPRIADSLLPRSAAHPWARAFDWSPEPQRSGIDIVPISVGLGGNSAFPFGVNDGPVWAGRGATASISGGVAGHVGTWLHAQIAPIAFVAQNANFPLRPNGQTGTLAFADPNFPTEIDAPQRFGSGAYGRVDPGNSYVRVDAGALEVGVSTANEWWGPATRYPYILGTNAAGIPHAFIGTSRAVGPSFLRVNGHLIYGIESQSDWSAVSGPTHYVNVDSAGTRRFASGFVVTAQTSALPGFEFAAERFFHSAIPAGGIPGRFLRKPLQGLFKAGLPVESGFLDTQGGGDNQEFALAARWVLPRAGMEVYGEYGREDHNYDLRDALEEPDHARAYSFGVQKTFVHSAQHMSVLRAEVIDGEPSETARHRDEGLLYVHAPLRQGHTQLGQYLGTAIGAGEFAGATIALDRYDPRGRWTVGYERTVSENGDVAITTPASLRSTVANTLSVERLHFARWGDVALGAALTDALDWQPQVDRFNASAFVRFTVRGTGRAGQ